MRPPSRPESAVTARRITLVRRPAPVGALARCSAEHAVLLVSELVGNAVRHTGARVFGLRMLRRRGWIRIEVRDPSRGLPCLMPVHELDISGRGLFLVDKPSDRWGVDLLPRGKTTWFEMRVADRSGRADGESRSSWLPDAAPRGASVERRGSGGCDPRRLKTTWPGSMGAVAPTMTDGRRIIKSHQWDIQQQTRIV